MLYPTSLIRSRRSRVALVVAAGWLVWLWHYHRTSAAAAASDHDPSTLAAEFPLAWKHIHMFNGTGGAWYIPEAWTTDIDGRYQQPHTILEAATYATAAASGSLARRMDFAQIPLIVHQTWMTASIDGWTPMVVRCVERWLTYAVGQTPAVDEGGPSDNQDGPPMAYFFWDDAGVDTFMRTYEPDFVDAFYAFFSPVERADIFRVLVCKWFGGIYGDVDTEPLRHPAKWIQQADLAAWTDPETGATFGHNTTVQAADRESESESDRDNAVDEDRPVTLLVGLEADVDPASDAYWRMGYTYPVQLTQWALASAPQHAALAHFIDLVRALAAGGPNPVGTTVVDDPLLWTGPPAITAAISAWLQEHCGLRWNAVTGLHDNGKAKLVSDVLVLPITGFSPGRGRYGNMGSKPVSDADARLFHHAQGSWRKFDVKDQLGKLCRTLFGLCRPESIPL
ncbi:glucosyll transferase [Sporothrix schenckii 1099-18]|uniref:Glucosyll transferase n=1 Tax=Sporothrix schenckii 1099-18 TaxID=1397361 RepID=A0A0F2M992_SPOSC|nr:glucosyll transferase [Sporothrix schenckii 1099-18]KJR86273.1 glucosyll transferase [Sporothrix schenckii 1099-18]